MYVLISKSRFSASTIIRTQTARDQAPEISGRRILSAICAAQISTKTLISVPSRNPRIIRLKPVSVSGAGLKGAGVGKKSPGAKSGPCKERSEWSRW